jgi:hypothetical protein
MRMMIARLVFKVFSHEKKRKIAGAEMSVGIQWEV